MKKCPFCAEEIQDEAIFCRYCKRFINNEYKMGIGETQDKVSKTQEPYSLDYTKRQTVLDAQPNIKLTNQSRCEACGGMAPTKYVKFYQNIGALIVRHEKRIEGNLCKNCIDEYFWKFTGTTLLLGWWGVISFFVTPIALINNVSRYLGTIGMARTSIR